jgi:outer membrane protein assembly factor BamB
MYQGWVIVTPGAPGASIVAYDKWNGNEVWAQGDHLTSYASPQLAEFPGQSQLLHFHADGLSGHDTRDGHELWHFPWISNPAERNNICQPLILPPEDNEVGRVLVASSYDQGCSLLRISSDGTQQTVKQVWRNRNLKPKFSSVVRRGDYVFGLDERILTCINWLTGERCWKTGRYGYGQLLLCDDVLVVQAESGEVVFVEATPDSYHELLRFPALEGRTWNHPVLIGPLLLVRNDREAACYELRARR